MNTRPSSDEPDESDQLLVDLVDALAAHGISEDTYQLNEILDIEAATAIVTGDVDHAKIQFQLYDVAVTLKSGPTVEVSPLDAASRTDAHVRIQNESDNRTEK